MDTTVRVDVNGELHFGHLELGRKNSELVVALVFNFVDEIMDLDGFLGGLRDHSSFKNKDLLILSGRNLPFGHFLNGMFCLVCDLTWSFSGLMG